MCVGQSEKWAKHTHTAAHLRKQMWPWWEGPGRVRGGSVGFWMVKSEVKQQMCPWRLDSRPECAWGAPLR